MTTAIDPLHLENQVCFGLVTAARSVVAFYKPFLEPLGLTHPQYLVMLALWEHGEHGEHGDHGDLGVKKISDLLMLEPATVSPLIKRLEAQGLLTRRRDERDERHLQVGLTAQGRTMRDEALKIPPAIAAKLQMTPAEFASMRKTLDRLLAAMARA